MYTLQHFDKEQVAICEELFETTTSQIVYIVPYQSNEEVTANNDVSIFCKCSHVCIYKFPVHISNVMCDAYVHM